MARESRRKRRTAEQTEQLRDRRSEHVAKKEAIKFFSKGEGAQSMSMAASDSEGDDVETQLKKYNEKRRSGLAPSSTLSAASTDPFPARIQFSAVQNPGASEEELVVFGGCNHLTSPAVVYGDLYRWQVVAGTYRKVECWPAPCARSSHQAVTHRGAGGVWHMYVFGGDFSGKKEFHHFDDLWRLNMKTWTWEDLSQSVSVAPGTKGGRPCARSGHRMVVYKSYILLFGGYYDIGDECRYMNDMYALHIPTLVWSPVNINGIPPSPRAGCAFFITELSVDPKTNAASATATASAGVASASASVSAGSASSAGSSTVSVLYIYGGYFRQSKAVGTEVYDMFSLTFRPSVDSSSAFPYSLTCSQVPMKGDAPPKRSAFGWTQVKNGSLVVYGGVCDKEVDARRIGGAKKFVVKPQAAQMESQCLDDAYLFDPASGRWHALTLSNMGIMESLGLASGMGTGGVLESGFCDDPLGLTAPSSRMSSLLFSLNSQTVFLYGGLSDTRTREIVHDDLWSLDTRRRNSKWFMVSMGSSTVWSRPADASDSEDSDNESGSSSGEDSDIAEKKSAKSGKGSSQAAKGKQSDEMDVSDDEYSGSDYSESGSDSASGSSDNSDGEERVSRSAGSKAVRSSSGVKNSSVDYPDAPEPTAKESLKAYLERTKDYWQAKTLSGSADGAATRAATKLAVTFFSRARNRSK